MKRKIGKFILVVSIIILIIALLLSFKKNNDNNNQTIDESYITKEVTGEVTNLKISNFSITKPSVFYNVNAKLEKLDDSEFNCKDYSIYLLDDENNLIYLVDCEKVGNFNLTSNIIVIDMQLNYEISSVTKIEIVKKEYGYHLS